MDSIPIVAFTGQVPTHLIGNDAFQEADNVGITRSATKHNFLVKDGKDLGPIIREAFHIAVDRAAGAGARRPAQGHPGQGGGAHLAGAACTCAPTTRTTTATPGRSSGRPGRMVRAKRPVLYVGGGVISVRRPRRAARAGRADPDPGHADPHGPGRLSDRAPAVASTCWACTGRYYANMAVHHSDVLVAVGARFDDRVTGKVDAFAPNAEIIHIDIDPSSISKNIKVDVPIVGDCRRVLRALVEAVREELKDDGGAAREARKPWHAQIAEWKRDHPLRYDWNDDVIKPQYVIQEISNLTQRRGDDRHRRGPAPDVGGPVLQVQAPAARGAPRAGSAPWATGCPPPWACRPRIPGKLVINIDGDGSFADEQPGAGHLLHRGPAREDRHHQQQRPRHGAAVAAHHLQGALLRDRPAAASPTG